MSTSNFLIIFVDMQNIVTFHQICLQYYQKIFNAFLFNFKTYIYIYIYIYMCVCVCVCVCQGNKRNMNIIVSYSIVLFLFPSHVRWTLLEIFNQLKKLTVKEEK